MNRDSVWPAATDYVEVKRCTVTLVDNNDPADSRYPSFVVDGPCGQARIDNHSSLSVKVGDTVDLLVSFFMDVQGLNRVEAHGIRIL